MAQAFGSDARVGTLLLSERRGHVSAGRCCKECSSPILSSLWLSLVLWARPHSRAGMFFTVARAPVLELETSSFDRTIGNSFLGPPRCRHRRAAEGARGSSSHANTDVGTLVAVLKTILDHHGVSLRPLKGFFRAQSVPGANPTETHNVSMCYCPNLGACAGRLESDLGPLWRQLESTTLE